MEYRHHSLRFGEIWRDSKQDYSRTSAFICDADWQIHIANSSSALIWQPFTNLSQAEASNRPMASCLLIIILSI